MRQSTWKRILFFSAAWTGLILFAGWNDDISFSVLNHLYRNEDIIIQKTQKIVGNFTALENNLGIIWIRVDASNLPETNEFFFRIKDIDAQDWYYRSLYTLTRLDNLQLFPFGFPIIEKSKGNTYVFELEPTEKEWLGNLRLNEKFPIVQVSYKFYKKELLQQPLELISFLMKKLKSYFVNPINLAQSTVIIGMIYVYWNIFPHPISVKQLPMVLSALLILYDIFFVFKISEGVITILTLFAVTSLIFMQASSKHTYVFGIVYLLFGSLLLFIDLEWIAQKSVIWGFILLSVGLSQDAINAIRSDSRRYVNVKIKNSQQQVP